eukprot:TRINITY_DN34576_c0_g1_i2.p1 TRINITY_DN34576_c0_g1~~TRINITY_DN34576_c0_g1_i2.p1  ORF type:complete len:168 (+),score=32.82 TRINITY_DN34576_c0_g1_i2:124-627(+)
MDMLEGRWSSATRASPEELVIDLKTGELRSRSRLLADVALPGELPAVHPSYVGKRHRFAYVNVACPEEAPFINSIQRLDVSTGTAVTKDFGPHGWAGEPVIIPKPGSSPTDEAAVWVAANVYDDRRHATDLVFLDGQRELQVQCRIELPYHIPFQFHGNWIADYVPS